MAFLPPWLRKPPPPVPRVKPGSFALAAMLDLRRDEFDAMPFGGWGGEAAVVADTPPETIHTPTLSFPPPDWEAEQPVGLVPDTKVDPAALGPMALAEIRARAGDDFDKDWPTPGPAISYGPLERPRPPVPDWEAEDREATARNRR